MVKAYFVSALFSVCSDTFFQINQNQPWNFVKQAWKQQRYSIGTVSEGGCIISTSAVWYVGHGTGQSQQTSTTVSRNRLSLLYSTKPIVSPNFLRRLMFYVMMYHIVRNYEEIYGIRVKIQTVFTFLAIDACTMCLRMYPLRIIHTLRRYNDSSGSMIPVHTIKWHYGLVLLLCAASCRSGTFIWAGQRLVCARVVLWCTSGYALMKHFAIVPTDRVAAFFLSICVAFFSGTFFLNQSQPWLDFQESNINESTPDTYVWYVCTSVCIHVSYV